MLKLARFAPLALAACLVPSLAFAVGNASGPPSEPMTLPLAPILVVLTVLSAILPLTSKLPGWGTISNIATGVVASLALALTDLAQTSPVASLGALGLAAFGAVVGYFRSEKRAAGTAEGEARIAALQAVR
jgi:hypothetical protein